MKIPEFCSVGRPHIHKTEFFFMFLVFRVPFDYPVHSLQETVLPHPMVSMESRAEGVPFACLESL